MLNLKVTLNNSGLLIFCILIQAHEKKKLTHHTSTTKTMISKFLVHVTIFEILLIHLSTAHELGDLSIA